MNGFWSSGRCLPSFVAVSTNSLWRRAPDRIHLSRMAESQASDESSGAVLGTSRILALLNSGQLFARGTWSPGRLRPAGYDLVISRKEVQLPGADLGSRASKFDADGNYLGPAFILDPGEFAFVRSVEEVCLPWSISGNIGIKNRFAQRGLLILTGLLVDPGWGLVKDPDSENWTPRPLALHFGIANVGPEPVPITLETEPVASMQFFDVLGTAKRDSVSAGPHDEVGFQLFGEIKARLQTLATRLEENNVEVRHTSAKVDSVTVFGLFIVIATLIGAIIAALLSSAGNSGVASGLESLFGVISRNAEPAWILALSLLGLGLVIGASAIWPLTRRLSRSTGIQQPAGKYRNHSWQFWRKKRTDK
jgi:deoxycytidine triphosphate deaminase